MSIKNVFVFAHQDDEMGSVLALSDALKKNPEMCFFVFVTNGGVKVPAGIRNAESLRVLLGLGALENNIFFSNFPDVGLHNCGHDLSAAIANFFDQLSDVPCRWFVPAYEGGHSDHDLVHAAVVMTVFQRCGSLDNVYEFPLYRAHERIPGFFHVMSPLSRSRILLRFDVSFINGLRKFLLLLHYRSQWKTWIGLGIQTFIRLVLLRKEEHSSVSIERVLTRPHSGKLFYESRFGVSYTQVNSAIREIAYHQGIDLTLLSR